MQELKLRRQIFIHVIMQTYPKRIIFEDFLNNVPAYFDT
jgi:hypothetical protein